MKRRAAFAIIAVSMTLSACVTKVVEVPSAVENVETARYRRSPEMREKFAQKMESEYRFRNSLSDVDIEPRPFIQDFEVALKACEFYDNGGTTSELVESYGYSKDDPFPSESERPNYWATRIATEILCPEHYDKWA